MNEDNELMVCGQRADLIGTDMTGTITAVCLRGIGGLYVEYEIVWFAGGQRHLTWLADHEVEPTKKTEKKTAGFKAEIGPAKLLTNGEDSK